MRPEDLSKYRPDIDGLRAFAVLSVLIFHLNNNWLIGGFVGVDIFFVISGFLITQIITREVQDKRFSFVRFYGRRVRRIFPALFVMLLVTAAAVYLSFPKEEYSSFFSDFKYASAQIANIHFAREVDYMGVGVESSPLLHTWSLGVEEQFYLFWPLLVVFLGVKYLPSYLFIFLVGSLLACEYFLYVEDVKQAFYMVYARAYELMIGAFTAWLYMNKRLENPLTIQVTSLLGMLLMVLSIFFIHHEGKFPGVMALIPACGAALFIYAGRDGMANKILSQPVLVGIGLISYSLYLWHWPLISVTTNFTGEALGVVQAAVIAVLSFLLAYFSWRYVEKPFRGAPPSYIKTLIKALVLIAVMIVAGNFVRTHSYQLGRGFDDEMLKVAFEKTRYANPQCVEGRDPDEKTDPNALLDCVFKDGMPDVVLIGDSHGFYQKFVVEAWAQKQGLSFESLAISGCSMYVGNYSVYGQKGRRRICSSLSQALYDRIQSSDRKPAYIFVTNRYDVYMACPDLGEKQLRIDGYEEETCVNEVRFLLEESMMAFAKLEQTKTVFIGQAPVLKEGPSICLEKQQSIPLYKWFVKAPECPRKIEGELYKQELVQLHGFVDQEAQKYSNVHFFNITPYFTHLYNDKGELLYHDDDHISRFGSLHILKPLSDFLEK